MQIKLFSLCIALFGVIGCKEVTIKDGRVPEEYLSQAKQLEGTYYGTFDGKQAEVQIYFEGDKPLLHYKDARGTDPIDSSCNSQIDLLKKVVLVKKSGQYVVDTAYFGFHPGSCRLVRGRNIELDFSGTNQFTMAIYDYSSHVQHCDPGVPPRYAPHCRTEEIRHYITGKFYR